MSGFSNEIDEETGVFEVWKKSFYQIHDQAGLFVGIGRGEVAESENNEHQKDDWRPVFKEFSEFFSVHIKIIAKKIKIRGKRVKIFMLL